MIGTSSTRDTRNANLQLRADPETNMSNPLPAPESTIST